MGDERMTAATFAELTAMRAKYLEEATRLSGLKGVAYQIESASQPARHAFASAVGAVWPLIIETLEAAEAEAAREREKSGRAARVLAVVEKVGAYGLHVEATYLSGGGATKWVISFLRELDAALALDSPTPETGYEIEDDIQSHCSHDEETMRLCVGCGAVLPEISITTGTSSKTTPETPGVPPTDEEEYAGFDYSCRTGGTRHPAAVVWVRFFVADRDDDGTPNDWGVKCYDTMGPEEEARIPIRIPVPPDVLSALGKSTPPTVQGEL